MGKSFGIDSELYQFLMDKKRLIYFAGEQNPIPQESVRRYTFNKNY